MEKISKRFKAAVKLADQPAYKLAYAAGISPTILSKLMCGIEKIKPNDERIIAVGRLLGLSDQECFECESVGKKFLNEQKTIGVVAI